VAPFQHTEESTPNEYDLELSIYRTFGDGGCLSGQVVWAKKYSCIHSSCSIMIENNVEKSVWYTKRQ